MQSPSLVLLSSSRNDIHLYLQISNISLTIQGDRNLKSHSNIQYLVPNLILLLGMLVVSVRINAMAGLPLLLNFHIWCRSFTSLLISFDDESKDEFECSLVCSIEHSSSLFWLCWDRSLLAYHNPEPSDPTFHKEQNILV